MKIICSIILFLSSSLCAFANVGLPTFDFSNLVSSIESVTNALKFYEQTIKSMKDYTIKLSKLGENISPEKLLNLIKNFDMSSAGRKEILNSINKLTDDFMSINDEFELFMGSIEKSINDELGISTNGTIQKSIKGLRKSMNIEAIKNTINKKYEEAEKKITELENKKDTLIREYNLKKEQFDKSISDIEKELNTLMETSTESAVALSQINIKSSALNALRQESLYIEREMEQKIKEINEIMENNRKEVERLKISLLKLTKSISNLKNIQDTVTKKTNTNTYKESFQFEF